MPTEQDRKTGQELNYPEAVLLTNPIDPSIKGEVGPCLDYPEAVFLIVIMSFYVLECMRAG